MLARGPLARLAVANTSARDLAQLVRFLVARNASASPAARALRRAHVSAPEARRAYATTTSATTPTATVKKAVKAKAASKAAPRKSTATKAAKKPAKKSAAATKAKTKAKTKARTTKKAAPKKAASKKRVKKQLTPEEQLKAKILELRKAALRPPVRYHAVTAFNAYIVEQTQGKTGSATALLSEISPKFKNLTPAEREHYNHLASEKTAAKRAEYQAWIHSHTPEQIQAANNARAQLRRKLKEQGKPTGRSVYTTKLVDDRRPKRISNSFTLFYKERRLTSDFKGISPREATKLVAAEWKALSAGEKKKYQDEFAVYKTEQDRQLAATS